jgi:hypothetical protein
MGSGSVHVGSRNVGIRQAAWPFYNLGIGISHRSLVQAHEGMRRPCFAEPWRFWSCVDLIGTSLVSCGSDRYIAAVRSCAPPGRSDGHCICEQLIHHA